MKVEQVKLMIMVEDMDRALSFYSETFGLLVAERSPGWSELTWGDWILALHAGGAGTRRSTGLSFSVDDIDLAAAAVERAGGSVIEAPHQPDGEPIRLAVLVDPEGNSFMLSQKAR
jgi:predicted enzyme related to lactoylglutathione lyase